MAQFIVRTFTLFLIRLGFVHDVIALTVNAVPPRVVLLTHIDLHPTRLVTPPIVQFAVSMVILRSSLALAALMPVLVKCRASLPAFEQFFH